MSRVSSKGRVEQERKLWICPICERQFKIPKDAQDPGTCRDCLSNDFDLPNLTKQTKITERRMTSNADENNVYLRNISSTATLVRIIIWLNIALGVLVGYIWAVSN